MYTELKRIIEKESTKKLRDNLHSETWRKVWLMYQDNEKISDLCFFIDELTYNIESNTPKYMLEVFESETNFSNWIREEISKM